MEYYWKLPKESYILDSGFLEHAAANNIIVVFPQVFSSPNNSYACWDYWGYTGHNYLTADAIQIKAFKMMIQRLQGAPSAPALQVARPLILLSLNTLF